MLSRLSAGLVVLFLIFGAMAFATDVKDDAAFFSPSEIQKANAEIRALKSANKRDLVIETYRNVPANRSVQVKSMNVEDRNKFFGDWAKDRARLVARDDIFVLICQDPPHIQITVGHLAQKNGFGVADRDKLRDILVSRFKEKDYNKGLRESVSFVAGRFDAQVPGMAQPVVNEVKDLGGFFSPLSVQKANAEIKSLQQRFKKDIVIETFKSVPPSKSRLVESMTPEGRKRFFGEWIQERAKEAKKDGIFVLICQEPSSLQVGIGPETLKKAFTTSDRDKLTELLISKFREKKFDEGLLESVNLIQARLEANLGPATPVSVANVVKDQGAFFGPDAISQANAELKALNQQFKKDIFVETFASVPQTRAKEVEAMGVDARNRFFADWLRERMNESKKDGIFVLICKNPTHLQVGVSDQMQKKAFTVADRDKLKDLLVSQFREKKFDQCLIDGVKFIQSRLDENETPPLPAPVVNDVKDYGGLLSPNALVRTRSAIREIKQNLNQDLLVETFKSVPKSKIKLVEGMDQPARSKFFADWLTERVKESKSDAIHILICQDPPQLQIGVGGETLKKAFTTTDRDNLTSMMAAQFKNKQYEQGVLNGLAMIYDTVDKNLAKPVAPLAVGEAKDYSGMFTAGVLALANQELKNIQRDRKRTVTLEAFRSALPGEAKKVVAMDQATRENYFADLQKKRLGDSSGGDFAILFCREPRHVSILEKEPGKVLTPNDRKVLNERLNALFREDKFDQGLTEAVSFVSGTLAAPDIKDGASLFSAVAIDTAREQVKELRRNQKIPLNIQSFVEALPEKDPNGSGIALLIRKEPPQAKVIVEDLTPTYAFSQTNAEQLRDRIQKRIEEKRFDDALGEATLFVRDTVKENLANGPAGVGSKPAPLTNSETKKEKTISDQVEEVKDKVIQTMEKDVNMPIWKLVLMLGGGFLGLWVLFGILRALFGGGGKPPSQSSPGSGSPPRQGAGSFPTQNSNDPWANQRNSNPAPPQPNAPQPPFQAGQPPVGGANPGFPGNPPNFGNNPPRGNPPGGYGQHPTGYGQNSPGYAGNPSGNYGSGNPYAPPPQQGSGGGFMKSVLGGMLGGAAGSWVYDSLRGSRSGSGSASVNWGGSARAGDSSRSNPAGSGRSDGLSTSGGDFGSSGESPYATSGGDFGTQATGGVGYSSAGGDFGAPPVASPSSGGDFGAGYLAGSSSGGDFGSGSEPVSSAGADFGSSEPVADAVAGGDFGGGSRSSGDFGSSGSFENTPQADFGGGGFAEETPVEEPQTDFGSGDSGAGGGEFGGGDTSGGGGGDFGGGDASSGSDFGADQGGTPPNSGGDF